jgi:hypothetical protein
MRPHGSERLCRLLFGNDHDALVGEELNVKNIELDGAGVMCTTCGCDGDAKTTTLNMQTGAATEIAAVRDPHGHAHESHVHDAPHVQRITMANVMIMVTTMGMIIFIRATPTTNTPVDTPRRWPLLVLI